MSKIILISGTKQSGKTTCADYLVNHLSSCGKWSKIYSFADSLKEFCMKIFGLSYAQCYGTDNDKNTLTIIKWNNLPIDNYTRNELIQKHQPKSEFLTARQLLEIFGTNICRNMYYDCWAEATLRDIKKESPQYALVADCRFPNELEVFKSYDPYVIRLCRNLFNSKVESEVALNDYDFKKFANHLVVPNQNWTVEEKNEYVINHIKGWL